MNRAQRIGFGATAVAVLALLGSLVAGLGDRTEGAPAEPGAPPARGERVRVEVLNAAGVPGLARAATERLREHGFDVVYYGNAAEFGRDSSVVLARQGSDGVAREVADAAGIDRVRSEPDSTRYVDVSVILGRDWSGIPAEPDSTAGAGPPTDG